MTAEPIPGALFREAMAHFASGVTVVAAHGEAGVLGFTATGFTSVSLAPPLVLVCVGKRASVHDGVVGAELFGVSVLSDRQAPLAEQLARSSGVERFRGVPLQPARVPLLAGALVHLACRRYGRHDAGDHTILVGEVLEGSVGDGRPLVHFARRFGAFVADPAPRAGPPPAIVRRGETA
jgi:flavin reductase (DIM6/NTAB) family NADH-FMN oxidoreductase RutF